MRLRPRHLVGWLRRHPEAVGLPVAVVVLALLGFSLSVGLPALAAILAGTGFVLYLANRVWPGEQDGAGLHARLAVHSLTLGVLAYATGWGAALSLVFVVAIAENVRLTGSSAVRPAVDWSLVAIALAQLGIQLGPVPSSIELPAVHGVAIVGALVLGVVASRIHLFTARMERAEAEVAARERRFRTLVARSSDATFVVDHDGLVVYQSSSATHLLGVDDDALLGTRATDLVHPDDRERVAREAAELLAAGGRGLIECRLRRRDGRYVDVESNCHDLSADPEIGGVVVNTRDVTERKQLEAQLHHRAFHDGLTGLANRHLFRDRVAHAVQRSQRHPAPFAVLFLDLDGFKLVNDTLGHEAGDGLLKVVAQRIRLAIRDHDTACRLGGDEFAVLVEDLTDRSDAARVADRVLAAIRATVDLDGQSVSVDGSIGIAVAEGVVRIHDGSPGEAADALLRNADIAMYTAKNAGKGRYEVFEPSMHATVVQRLQIERDLQLAVERDELVLHYQPIVRLDTGELVALEALLRWRHPERGLLPPIEFIPVAEETGLIVTMGSWVIREATRQVALWNRRFPDQRPVHVSVNVSPRQLGRGDLVEQVARALAASGLPAECLTLEITESAVLADTHATVAVLHDLKALGVQLAVDDFGTGYSSLSYLQNLPFDVLKIDRTFVAGMSQGTQNPAVVRAILDLGHALQLTSVAEGIEVQEQLDRFRELGCTLGQGYLFARPASGTDIEAMLVARAWPGADGTSDPEPTTLQHD